MNVDRKVPRGRGPVERGAPVVPNDRLAVIALEELALRLCAQREHSAAELRAMEQKVTLLHARRLLTRFGVTWRPPYRQHYFRSWP